MADADALIPKSITSLRGYTKAAFGSDLIAGLTVGLLALPLAMAFAISSGLSPQAGIYTAIVAGFLISALGGSRTQVGGPTGAFVVVVAGIVAEYGVDGLFMCTLMAGVVLILLGVTGLGTAVKYIPRPVVIGFTNGIAVLIASTQLVDFFGLELRDVPGEFIARLEAVASSIHTLSLPTTLLASVTLVGIALVNTFASRVPGSVVALFGGTAIAWGFGLSIETIDTRFGGIPSGLPAFAIPSFRADLILPLLSPTLTIAMLGAIESLLSAVVADRMSGDKHNPNMELIAQGVANVVSPLVGGLPATGAIARTATSIRSGAKTPVAGMTHALVLLAILLWGAPLAKHIPLSVLAAILIIVAYRMSEWREVPDILRSSKADVAVWGITFALTVLADLTVAVEAGMILAALLYIQKVTFTTTVSRVTPEYVAGGFAHSLQTNDIPDGAVVFRIHGPFLFGATDKLASISDALEELPKVVILRLRNMTALDATGLAALEELAEKLEASGRQLLLCGAREQPAQLMRRSDLLAHVGAENVTPNFETAVDRARAILALEATP
jgi:SulP family sulfate permease